MSIRKLVVVILSLWISHSAYAANLAVTRVLPAGDDVAQHDQVVIEFNQPVVPLGRMDRKAEEIPINIQPAVNCQWRWLSRTTLACQLDKKDQLKLATRYTVTVQPGIKTEDGTTLSKVFTHQFVTNRPTVSTAWIKTWNGPDKPIIRVTFDQPVVENSLPDHLFFLNQKNNQRVPAKIVKEPQQPHNDYISKDYVAQQAWLVYPAKKLPLASEIALMMEPGIMPQTGNMPSIAAKDILRLRTFPEFKFLGVVCQKNQGDEIVITAKQPQLLNEKNLCDPLSAVKLRFNSPVARQELTSHISLKPALRSFSQADEATLPQALLDNLELQADSYFDINLGPATGIAMQRYTITLQPLSHFSRWIKLLSYLGIKPKSAVVDVFDRHLAAPLTIYVNTGHRKPHYELPYQTAILEKNADSEIPLYVTNLQTLNFTYDKLTQAGLATNQHATQTVPAVQDIQFAVPLKIRDLLAQTSGVLKLQLTTQPKVGEEAAQLMAEVTPYQVEAKIGHYNSLVWVTDLATGLPVPHAKVSLYVSATKNLTAPTKNFASAQTDDTGVALLPGEVQFSTVELSQDSEWSLRVDTKQEMAWLPFNYDFAISAYNAGDVSTQSREKYGHIVTWGTTAQGIYRPGDTINYKIYVRDQNVNTLTVAPAGSYQLEIKDPTGKVIETIKAIKLNQFGALQGKFTIARTAIAGWYTFSLKADFSKENWEPLRVLVTDYSPSAFKVVNQLNGNGFTSNQPIEIYTQAKLQAGGGYANANLRVTAALEPKTFVTKNSNLKDFDFYQPDTEQNTQQVYQKLLKLNDKGEARVSFKMARNAINYGTLRIESAVQDERGKYVTAQAVADYFGVDRFLGWHPKQWTFIADKPAQVDYAVVDKQGNPTAGTPVDITIEREINKAARVKSAGEVYTTQYTHTWEKVGTCHHTSQATPVSCVFTPKQAGNYRLTANLFDSEQRPYVTKTQIWVAGKDYVMWDQDTDSALPIMPEKNTYQVGEQAHFLLKNPYPGALALVTIERYGVIDHWIQKLESSTPTITIPIKSDYLPGFYLSVSVFAPRANNKPLQTGQIDLAKPTVRFGYQKVIVTDPSKQLLITAKTDRNTYKPGETVKLHLQASPRINDSSKSAIELAVAVVDQSVLDLLPDANKHYDVYRGLYKLDYLDLKTYSLISRLIGRQKFEKKGANPGGDGGAAFSMRSLFNSVSYWNPSIPVDAQGKAEISFVVPDNLTRWKVLVLGVTPTDRMGTAVTEFTVSRSTEIRPVMPNQILEQDRFVAGFSVINRMQQTRTLSIDIAVAGAIDKTQMANHYTASITLQPFQRKIVTVPVTVGDYHFTNKTQNDITLTVKAGDASDTDALQHHILVNPKQLLETVASYGSSEQNQIHESVAVPNNIRANVGQLSLTITPTIIGNIEGVFRFAREYPYTCWEQKLTKAILAAHYKILKPYLAASLQWPDSNELPKTTLQDAINYQAANGGMSYFVANDQYTDPYLSAFTALSFHWLQQLGYTIPDSVNQNLIKYLQKFLRQNKVNDLYTKSMTATTRAVALAALAQTQSIELADLDRLYDHLSTMSLFGLAHYLQAALHVSHSENLQKIIFDKIMSHANFATDKLVFTEQLDDGYARILTSQLRDNCAVLSALLDYQAAYPKQKTTDVVKLVSYITQARGIRDHWENTQENLFCTQALTHYSQLYEKQVPSMQLVASVNDEKLGEGNLSSVRDPALTFIKPITANDIGKTYNVELQREGVGRYYYNTRLQYSPFALLMQDENHGIEIHREYSVQRNNQWVLLNKNNDSIKPGDLVRVDLYLNLTAPRNFVVVDDPVAGGLEPVNAELATSSQIDANQSTYKAANGSYWFRFNDWHTYNESFGSFYHQELRNETVRYYADHLEPGHYHLSYVAQAISAGDFTLLPTIAQEMYSPEVNGKTKVERLVIR